MIHHGENLKSAPNQLLAIMSIIPKVRLAILPTLGPAPATPLKVITAMTWVNGTLLSLTVIARKLADAKLAPLKYNGYKTTWLTIKKIAL